MASTLAVLGLFYFQVKIVNFSESQNILGAYPTLLMELDLLAMAPRTSSGCLERVFSTMGFVHSDLRNRLGVESLKIDTKLAFCLRALND